jgi:hypothetical protein
MSTEKKDELKFVVKIERDLTYKRLADILVGAFEGGSNYWIDTADAIKPTSREFIYEEGEPWPRYEHPFNPGGGVEIIISEEDPPNNKKILNLEAIKRGVEALSKPENSHILNEIIDENDDADTADCFLQLCLFGEVIYG